MNCRKKKIKLQKGARGVSGPMTQGQATTSESKKEKVTGKGIKTRCKGGEDRSDLSRQPEGGGVGRNEKP